MTTEKEELGTGTKKARGEMGRWPDNFGPVIILPIMRFSQTYLHQLKAKNHMGVGMGPVTVQIVRRYLVLGTKKKIIIDVHGNHVSKRVFQKAQRKWARLCQYTGWI